MIRIIKVILIIVFLECIFTNKALAVVLDISNIPATISASPFFVTVTVFGANAGKNYLRVDLFKDGTTKYFGETFNGGEWYTGSVGTSYFPIDIISPNATATADVQAQIGAPSDTDYIGSGQYKLRVRRYTSSSGYSAGNSYDIYIDLPTPTPTETPQPTQTPTSTPTPTKTATPTPTPIRTPITTQKSTPAPTESSGGTVSTESGGVLGLSFMSPTPIVKQSSDSKNKSPIFAVILICTGVAFMGTSLYLGLKASKSSGLQNDI